MIIPINQLAPDILYNLVESFVLREGTDYGEMEFSLDDKVQHVLTQLHSGEAVVQYSELHESINIVPKHALESDLQGQE